MWTETWMDEVRDRSGRRVFSAEELASAKVRRQESAWSV